MIVTPHARQTAMFRLLQLQGVVDIEDQLPFHALEQAWHRMCGLRRADLMRTVEELTLSGLLRLARTTDGLSVELTDRGLLKLQDAQRFWSDIRWTSPISDLMRQWQTHRVLRLAHQRTLQRPQVPSARLPIRADRRTAA